jgi:transposase
MDPGSGNIKLCNEEYYKLLKAYEDVKMERDILKKAVAIFSKPKQ